MWVRSQDKMALMNATTFRMYYDGKKFWRIYCDQKCISEEYTNLGTYSTKEKALANIFLNVEPLIVFPIILNSYILTSTICTITSLTIIPAKRSTEYLTLCLMLSATAVAETPQ